MDYRLSGSVWRSASFWIVGGTEKWKSGRLNAGRILTELGVVVWHRNFYQFHGTRRHSSVDHFIGHQLSCTEFHTAHSVDQYLFRTSTALHCVSKKRPTIKFSVTLSNLNRFSKLLHCWKAYKIRYKTNTTLPTSP